MPKTLFPKMKELGMEKAGVVKRGKYNYCLVFFGVKS